MKREKTCSDCVHYGQNPNPLEGGYNDFGECRRHAPALTRILTKAETKYPFTNGKDFCGDLALYDRWGNGVSTQADGGG